MDGLAVAPIQVRRAFEEVILQLEQAILDGRLRPGDRLPPERELAERMGVSRASVREALRVLDSLGVLSARRGARAGSTISAGRNGLSSVLGLYVAVRDIPIRDLVRVREALEGTAVELAAANGDAAELEGLVQTMEKTLEIEAFMSLDTEFHQAIARASGNGLLPLLMEALRDAMSRRMHEAFAQLEDSDRERVHLTRQHAEIARLVRARKGPAAVAAVRKHIHGFYSRALLPIDRAKAAS